MKYLSTAILSIIATNILISDKASALDTHIIEAATNTLDVPFELIICSPDKKEALSQTTTLRVSFTFASNKSALSDFEQALVSNIAQEVYSTYLNVALRNPQKVPYTQEMPADIIEITLKKTHKDAVLNVINGLRITSINADRFSPRVENDPMAIQACSGGKKFRI
ncbi:MAG: hypothetical protein CMH30_05070 [Micavibrio sp.]|nr:hypothetical protein [Micavibrio sp.]